ncbi:hypothetical protein ASG17_05215 [Brevundimonas sp. Leaf363]|uniref:hypothetical protein n=1 Tax=Brevundimonas sp. Leaf363 TaxID=1736353 RepID=UPI0006FF0F2E|nr:hypothetical protein [Brevundimonas sp. Leaf363]KQS55486.1 hypothetical protein ASG17_05215 [Brevundimonas sp. Leaf363]
MQLGVLQVITGLLAAVAFVIAIIAAGAGLISGVFMLAGVALLAWLTYSLIRGVLRHRAGA